MALPGSFDVDLHALLQTNALSLPVHKGEYVPPNDLAPYNSGYIVWSYSSRTTLLDSEGHSTLTDGKQVIDFDLDVVVYGDTNAKRLAAMDTVLDILQPMSGSKRTFLTSVLQGSTFFNFVIYRSTEQIFTLKSAQSTVDIAGEMMTFSCRVSY